MTREELIELSDLNRKDNIKYISSEAQGIAIILDSDRYAPTLCKLERAYICGRRKSENRIDELIALINAERKRQKKCDDVHLLKIADLEKENAELKDKLNNLSKVAEVRLANWQKYEQENAELKERADKADLDSVTFFNQLCKAKEIIKDFLSLGIFGIFKGTTAEEIVDKAEDFLKEEE